MSDRTAPTPDPAEGQDLDLPGAERADRSAEQPAGGDPQEARKPTPGTAEAGALDD